MTADIGLILPVDTGSTLATLYSGAFLILLLFVLLFAAVYTADKEKIKAQEDMILQMQTHLALLEELQQEVRSFRHDFTNLLAGASRQAMDGDLKGIRDFMQNTGAYFDDKLGNEIQHLECISNIKIYPLQSLITTKIAKMQEEGIAYLLEVPNPVMESGMRTEDLLRCIGILIDNALEEAGEEGYYYSLKILDEVRHIPMNRIIHFEAAGMNHQICLHMKDEIIGFYGSLQNLQEELGGRFWRCHRGCLVNIYRVCSIFQSMKPA